MLFKKKGGNNSELSDEALVDLVKGAMDADTFGLLYDRFAPKVYRKCLSMTRDKDIAHDLTHDIFLKAFLNMNKFDGRSKFGTWLYRITYNYCLDHLRRKQRDPVAPDVDFQGITPRDEERNEEQLLGLRADRLEEVLAGIDVTDRAILLFKYQEDMSIKDLTELLEMSESAVKMRLFRARERALAQYKVLYSEDP
ncbi:MAG: RNA polymerase sigma factor [Flavobacteriales bacterium]|nr:RNA polymerase sigma factor [Flavobacteriales bacterium]